MGPKAQYKILKAETLDEIGKMTAELTEKGWQPVSPLGYVPQNKNHGEYFYHEMAFFEVPEPQAPEEPARDFEAEERAFNAKLNRMDPKISDLLAINSIDLVYIDGKLYTRTPTKVHEGIYPPMVLDILKNSKHCPIDLDEEKFLNDIDSLL